MRRVSRSVRLIFLVLSFCFLPIGAGQGAENQVASNVALVNQEGKPFQLYDLKGSYLFVSFIYTRCPFPTMCPLTLSLNQLLFHRWKETKSKLPLRFLLVTLNPRHDTPSVLKQFAKDRKVNLGYFTLATGTPQALSALFKQFEVAVVPEGEFVGHNNRSILLDPQMAVLQNYAENKWTADQVLKDMGGH